jgi:hypothetical protein
VRHRYPSLELMLDLRLLTVFQLVPRRHRELQESSP